MMKLNDSAHVARLNRLASPALRDVLGAALVEGGNAIVADAKQSIMEGGSKGPRGGHVPSKPGEAPNNDTGELVASGFVSEVVDEGGALRLVAGFAAPYSVHLELGTSKMLPRPFLQPAVILNRRPILRHLAQAASAFMKAK